MGLVPISSFDRVPELAEILIRLQKVKSSGAHSLLSGGSMRAASEPAQKARGVEEGTHRPPAAEGIVHAGTRTRDLVPCLRRSLLEDRHEGPV
jgi:hypothetical protein